VVRTAAFWLVLPFLLAQRIVAGLGVGRFGWSGAKPLAVQEAGLYPGVLREEAFGSLGIGPIIKTTAFA
jgi:hypothetical protein